MPSDLVSPEKTALFTRDTLSERRPPRHMGSHLHCMLQALIGAALLWIEQPPSLEHVPHELVSPMADRLATPANPLSTPAPPPPGVAAVHILGWMLLCDRFAAASVSALDAMLTF